MQKIIFLILALSGIGRMLINKDINAALIIAVAMLLFGSMIWFRRFWAEVILPFGFWESKARDYKSAGSSANAVALIGWVLMLLLVVTVYLKPA